MKKLLLLFILIWGSAVVAQNKIPVTFKVNLNVQKEEGNFDPKTDVIYIRGNFQREVGDTTDWGGATFKAKDPDGDLIYELTIDFPDTTKNKSYLYKFVINDGGWEPFEPPRSLTVTPPSVVLPVVYWNNDSVVTKYVYNTLNFTADLSDIYGTGTGFYDPNQDSLLLQGLNWNSTVSVIEGNRRMIEDPFNPAIFTTTMKIRGVEGDSTDWKTKAFPDGRFFNTGWEVKNSRWYKIKADGSVTNIPLFKPDIYPQTPALSKDVKVTFHVNINGARNRYTQNPIDLSKVLFVGLKGQNSVLGSWGGGWTPADTAVAAKTLWVMNDKAIDGDKVAGDNIWSCQITFPVGNTGGPSLFKFGIYYTGVEADAPSGFHPMDNEFVSGDHSVNIKDVPSLEYYYQFGNFSVTSVKKLDGNMPKTFSLDQNYPNPFNPETTIKYSISENTMVEIAIFNILGEKVSTLLNAEQKAGSYEVKFNASTLSSGVYFYRLTAGDSFTMTKKMLLMK